MKQKHTPGPWIFTPQKMPAIHDTTGAPIAMQCRRNAPEEAQANAALIAAAPELLEALKAAEEVLTGSFEDEELTQEHIMIISDIRAAIAKAEGK